MGHDHFVLFLNLPVLLGYILLCCFTFVPHVFLGFGLAEGRGGRESMDISRARLVEVQWE